MTKNDLNPLGSEPILPLLARFAIPSIISMLVSALYNMVDQFFIGRSVGMLGNAATNVAFPLTITCTALSLLCGIGASSNFGIRLGEGKKEEAAHFAGKAITMMILLGIALFLLARLTLTKMLMFFGATNEILEYARIYTGITSLGFPFLILTTGASSLIRADGSPRFSMFCTLVGAILNTILDPILIFGFDMGISGAAWATVIGQVVSACLVLGYLKRFHTVTLHKEHFLPSFTYFRRIASLGMTPFCNQMAMMVVQIVLNNTLTYYGASSSYGSEIPLACAGIISKVNMLYFALIIGISQGIQPIISFNYGAKNYLRVRNTYLLAVKLGTCISVVAFFCFQLFPRQIIGFFGSGSEEYFHFAEQYFRIYLFCTFLNQVQPLTGNFFTSIGKPIKGIFLSLTRQILFLLPLLVILPLFFGIDGVMFAAPVADLTAGALAGILADRELKQLSAMEKQKASLA